MLKIDIPMTDAERIVAAAETIKNLQHALDGVWLDYYNPFLQIAKELVKEAKTILEDGERSL